MEGAARNQRPRPVGRHHELVFGAPAKAVRGAGGIKAASVRIARREAHLQGVAVRSGATRVAEQASALLHRVARDVGEGEGGVDGAMRALRKMAVKRSGGFCAQLLSQLLAVLGTIPT